MFADQVLARGASSESRASKRQRTDHGRSRAGALDGLKLYVIHCKAALNGADDQAQLIAQQIRTLVLQQELGIEVIAVVQGMRIEI